MRFPQKETAFSFIIILFAQNCKKKCHKEGKVGTHAGVLAVFKPRKGRLKIPVAPTGKPKLHVFPLRRAKGNKENSVTKKKVRSKNQPKARFPEAQRIHTPSRPAKTGAGMTRERFWMTRPGFRTGGRLKAASSGKKTGRGSDGCGRYEAGSKPANTLIHQTAPFRAVGSPKPLLLRPSAFFLRQKTCFWRNP